MGNFFFVDAPADPTPSDDLEDDIVIVSMDEVPQEPIPENGVHLYKSTNHLQDFLSCVRSRKRPICDVEVGCRSVTVCHLGNLAYWNHRKLKWNPEKERFVGDDEANRWLNPPKREPWKV